MAQLTRCPQAVIKTDWLKVGVVVLVVGFALTLLIERATMGVLTIPIAAVVAILSGGYIRRACVQRGA